jgi:hypothetical protein
VTSAPFSRNGPPIEGDALSAHRMHCFVEQPQGTSVALIAVAFVPHAEQRPIVAHVVAGTLVVFMLPD